MSTIPVVHEHHLKTPRTWLSSVGGKLRRYVTHLFRPEVVEVTFKVDGGSVTYTYTKVDEKKVA